MRDLDWDRALKTAPKADLSDAVQAAAASGQIPYEKGNFVPSYKRGGVVRSYPGIGQGSQRRGYRFGPCRCQSLRRG